MDLGKVIRELDVEPDEELVPAPSEALRTVPEPVPAGARPNRQHNRRHECRLLPHLGLQLLEPVRHHNQL